MTKTKKFQSALALRILLTLATLSLAYSAAYCCALAVIKHFLAKKDLH